MNRSDLKIPAIVLFLFYALYGFLLIPLLQSVMMDAVLTDTLWYDLLDLLQHWLEIFGIALTFAFLLHALHRHTLRECVPLLLLSYGAVIFKYLSSFLSLSFVSGSIDLTMDYSLYLVSFLVEAIEILALALHASRAMRDHRERTLALEKASRTLGAAPAAAAPLLPFPSFFDRSNPLLRSLMTSMASVTVIHCIIEIVSEIAYTMMGAPYHLSDLPITLLYCLLLILIPCFLGYLIAAKVASLLEGRAAAKKA